MAKPEKNNNVDEFIPTPVKVKKEKLKRERLMSFINKAASRIKNSKDREQLMDTYYEEPYEATGFTD